ncbi:MAG: glycosyltransferase family 4 protein [Acidobacteriaceae bacterium]|nr:glycosyltransferase family 4 protein [Acidobacteriaceae bacterium]
MKIWLVKIGEPVPISGALVDRVHRTGYLAQFLAARKHQVVWWTTTFDHYRKKHISEERTVPLGPNLAIRLLRGRGYAKNVGVGRLIDHALIARKFRHAIAREPKPDIIVTALPTVDLCLASLEYGRLRNVPVVLDMRDMWPDIFVDAIPGPLRPLARPLLVPFFRQARYACAHATAITGITEAFVEWGLRRGCRERSPLDRAFPFAYPATIPGPAAVRDAAQFWDAQGVHPGSDRLVVCFVGNLGRQFDAAHFLEAARILIGSGYPVQFVVCGAGERLEEYRKAAAAIPGMLFPGWIDAAKIHVLLQRSDVGIDPLPDRYDYLASINNKAVEYLSAGLPILSSPRHGVLCELLEREGCGLSYATCDAAGLASILTALHEQRQMLTQMSIRAREVFALQFAAEKVCGDMADHFEHIAGLNHPAPIESESVA